MKLLVTILAIFGSITISFSQSLNVPKQKKALFVKATATWCTPCGEYLWVSDSIHNAYHDSIVFINAHVSSSSIGDPYSGDFHNAFGGGGIPKYVVDATQMVSWPPSVGEILDSSSAHINSTIVANIAFKSTINGNSLTVNTTTEFFEDATDTFYVNVFIVENHVTSMQTVVSGVISVDQERVSRGPIMGGDSGMWGEQIATGNVLAGDRFDVSFTTALNSAWNTANLEIVAVIWHKNKK